MWRAWLLLYCVVLGGLPIGCSASRAHNTGDSAVSAEPPSVDLLIETYSDDGEPTGAGNGVAVSPNLVVTAFHGVNGQARAVINLGAAGAVDAKFWGADSDCDVAVLTAPLPSSVVALEMSDTEPPVGAPVHVTWRSHDGVQHSSDGVIFSKYQGPAWGRLLVTTCRGEPGASGSAVTTPDGRIVGITVGGSKEDRLAATPIGAVQALVSGGHEQELAEWNRQRGVSSAMAEAHVVAMHEAHGGDSKSAVGKLWDAVHADPHDTRAWWWLLNLLGKSGDEAEVQRATTEWLQTGDRLDVLDLTLGYSLFREGKADEAIQLFERSYARRPSAAALWYIALAYARNNDFHSSLDAAERASALDPDDPAIWDQLTSAALDGRKYDYAVKFAEKWSEREWSAESLLALGGALEMTDEHARARDAYERALQREPSHAQANARLGLNQLRAGDQTGGLQRLQKAHQLAPGDPWITYCLGYAYMAREQYPEAIRYFELASPGREAGVQSKSLRAMATCYKKMGDKTGMSDALRRLLAADPYEYNRAKSALDSDDKKPETKKKPEDQYPFR